MRRHCLSSQRKFISARSIFSIVSSMSSCQIRDDGESAAHAHAAVALRAHPEAGVRSAIRVVALLLLTPVLVVVAVLIKLDSAGPIFFLQHRLRLQPEAVPDHQVPHYANARGRSGDQSGEGATIRASPGRAPGCAAGTSTSFRNSSTSSRATCRWSARARMRSRMIGEYERRIALYARRHNVKPGITGWAQIHGYRGETDTDEKMQKRVEHDLYYIDNWSLGLDLQILLRTALSPASYRNAY